MEEKEGWGVMYARLGREDIDPRLEAGATETSLTVYARSATGLLADDGCRWGVLVIPGGGYHLIAPGEGEPVALEFLRAGCQAFVLEYRVAPDCWPAGFLDACAAMAYIRRNKARYGIDKVAVCGFSAGGHLAGCLANLWNDPVVGEKLGLAPEDVRPDGAILCYPVISAEHDKDWGGLSPRLMGGGEVPEKLSLEKSVTAGNPPTFLWSTWTDGTVDICNSLLYVQALYEKKVPCEAHIFGWGPHAMGVGTPESARSAQWADPHAAHWVELCAEWLKGLKEHGA